MPKMDVDCYLGHWPFRKSYYTDINHLRRAHGDGGVTYGYVSSLQSIFWNDPMQAEEELAQSLKDTPYRQIATVNPALGRTVDYINEAVERFDIKAIRLCPGYHNYSLTDSCMADVASALTRHGLPLYITVLLEDVRRNYIAAPREISGEEIAACASSMDGINTLITQLPTHGVLEIADAINGSSNLYVSTSGLRGPNNCIKMILDRIDHSKLLYGSAYVLYAVQSTLAGVEHENIAPELKNRILWENAQAFFGK